MKGQGLLIPLDGGIGFPFLLVHSPQLQVGLYKIRINLDSALKFGLGGDVVFARELEHTRDQVGVGVIGISRQVLPDAREGSGFLLSCHPEIDKLP